MSGTSEGQAPSSEGLGSGERPEREAPSAEVAEPRGRPRRARRRRFSWRTPVAALLIILGCILAPLAVLGVWTANQVSDTSRYVANVTPLIHDPAIQNALTTKITNEIVTRIDVKGLTDQAAAGLSQKGFTRIGSLLQGVSGPLASGVQGFVHTRIHKIITGPRMANAWVQVNRVASQQLIAVLSGRATSGSGTVGVSNGQVTLDLAPLIAVAKQDLVARGLTIADKIPIIHVTFALFPSRNLTKAQSAYRLINDLKIVLPIVTVALLGLGVLAARGHRRALIGAGLGFAASMLVLGAGLAIARAFYLNSVPASASTAAAAAAFDILVRFIKTAAHPARGRPDRGRRRVLHRPVHRSGRNPLGVFLRSRPTAPRRIRWRRNQASADSGLGGPRSPRRTWRWEADGQHPVNATRAGSHTGRYRAMDRRN